MEILLRQIDFIVNTWLSEGVLAGSGHSVHHHSTPFLAIEVAFCFIATKKEQNGIKRKSWGEGNKLFALHPEPILFALNDSYQALVRVLLPEGILDYFELTKIVESIPGLNIYLEEKNSAPVEFKDKKLESKGWAPPAFFQRFTFKISPFVIRKLHCVSNGVAGRSKIQARL